MFFILPSLLLTPLPTRLPTWSWPIRNCMTGIQIFRWETLGTICRLVCPAKFALPESKRIASRRAAYLPEKAATGARNGAHREGRQFLSRRTLFRRPYELQKKTKKNCFPSILLISFLHTSFILQCVSRLFTHSTAVPFISLLISVHHLNQRGRFIFEKEREKKTFGHSSLVAFVRILASGDQFSGSFSSSRSRTQSRSIRWSSSSSAPVLRICPEDLAGLPDLAN